MLVLLLLSVGGEWLSDTVGGAYCTARGPSSAPVWYGDIAAGAGGAALCGMIGDVTAPPGGLGAGRCGIIAPGPACDEVGVLTALLPGVLRGIGGGARGFSKLSCVLTGKRGLAGGLIGWNDPPR